MNKSIIVALLTALTADGQDAWDLMASRGRSVVAEFKEQVHPHLTAEESAIAGQITYSVIPSPVANAQARIDSTGRRRIEIGAGMMLTYELFSVAMVMQQYGNPQCGKEYINVLFDGIAEATYLKDLGQASQPGVEPFRYAAQHPEFCKDVTLQRFRASPAAMKAQQALLGGSLRWLLAHELGHHLRGHVKSRPRDTEDSRQREEEADDFANKIAAKDGPDAIMWAMPAYLTMARLGASGENESKSTHPAGARRARIIFDSLRDLPDKDASFRADLKRRGLLDAWGQKIEMILKAIESDLP